ncbi:hypothetical protein A2U01_0065661, partial [Trifolium medium]|nr:hypothetical protein [Trifolium medium]
MALRRQGTSRNAGGSVCRASVQENGAPAPGETQKSCLNRKGRAPAQDTAPRRQLVKKAMNTDLEHILLL